MIMTTIKSTRKEIAMNANMKSEGDINYFQKGAREFSTITVSANFAALGHANWLNDIDNDDKEEEKAA